MTTEQLFLLLGAIYLSTHASYKTSTILGLGFVLAAVIIGFPK